MASLTEPQAEVKCCVATVEAGKRYSVLSSDGQTWYTVLVNPNGLLICSCLAGQHGKHCKHQDNVAGVLAADNWQAFADRRNALAIASGLVSAERVAEERQAAQAARDALIIPGPKPMTVGEIKAMAAAIPDELMWGA